MTSPAFVGDSWRFYQQDVQADGVLLTDTSLDLTVQVSVTLNDQPWGGPFTPTYETDARRWVFPLDLPGPGRVGIKWLFTYGLLVKTFVQSINVQSRPGSVAVLGQSNLSWDIGPTGPGGSVGPTGSGGYSVINVKNYGAIGNDAADDTTALQSAITAAIAQKLPLYLDQGVYKTTVALTINGPITIIGAGRRLSTIHLSSTTLNAIEIAINVALISDYGQVHFSNFGIIGDGTAPTAGDLINIQSPSGVPVESPVFRDLWLQNGWNGIHVVSGATYSVEKCDFYGQFNDAILLQDTTIVDHGDGQITGCFFQGRNVTTGASAVRLRSGGGLRFSDNIIGVYNYGLNVVLDGGVATSELFISNNRINLCTLAGIRIAKGSGTEFNNVTITGNKIMSAGVCLDLSDATAGWLLDLAITGNVFSAIAGGTPTCVTIAAATNFNLSSNTFKAWGGTTPTAITIGANATGLVSNNHVSSGFTTRLANASTNVMVIDPTSSNLSVSGSADLRTSVLAGTALTLTRLGADAFGCFLKWVKNRNASPTGHTSLNNGDEIGYFSWLGDDGAAAVESVRMAGVVDAAPSSGNMPGRWELWTNPGAGVVRRLYVDKDGHVLAQAPLGGIGYGTGAGGAVTQITSKSTGVTLNKVCGQITLHNAALAASGIASFILTNSVVTAADAIIALHQSAGTASAYRVWVSNVGAGTCIINVQNVTAGSLSEAIVLTFAIIKAVTA